MKVHILPKTKDRQENDLYCTNPIAVQKLLNVEKFNNNIWECCNGLGHISNVLLENGYVIKKSDIINYQNDDTEIIDMLKYDGDIFCGDIISNPPYKYSKEICEKAIKYCTGKIAMYMPLSFLASIKRKQFFIENPPKTVYVMSNRISCAKNGIFTNVNGSVDYCWIVWDNSVKVNSTELKWI